MARNLAIWIATLLASIAPFFAVLQVLDRSVFGSWDTGISIGHAAAYSFGITCLVCAPIQQFLPTERQGAWSYAFSYIFGFVLMCGLVDISTSLFLGWPLDRGFSVSGGERLMRIVLLSVAMVPLAIVTAGVFEISMNVLARFFPRQQRLK